jgi:hypothetical protein
MNEQQQKVGIGGEGYQAAGSITVVKGFGPEQMAGVMFALSRQLSGFLQEAHAIVEARCAQLHDAVLEEFARRDKAANPEAFKDPDYQYVLRSAQTSFARSGDEALKIELVRLLAERSVRPTRARISHILNQAIEVAGNLTREEYAALGVAFLILHVSMRVSSPEILIDRLRLLLEPLVGDLPEDKSAYEYLEAMRCVAINRVGVIDLLMIMHEAHGGSFSDGFTEEDLRTILPSHLTEAVLEFAQPVRRLFVADNQTIRFAVGNSEELRKEAAPLHLPPESIEALVSLFERSRWSSDRIHAELIMNVPCFPKLQYVWSKTELRHISLTALGKALGHSALTHSTIFDAPLETWVR